MACGVASKPAQGYEDVKVGEDRFEGRAYKAKTAVIIGYQVRKGGFEGPVVESSGDKSRMPILFTIGTNAVDPVLDDAIRTMRPGGVRRFETKIGEETYYVTVRLRAVKGISNFNVCTYPSAQMTAPLLCKPGALRAL